MTLLLGPPRSLRLIALALALGVLVALLSSPEVAQAALKSAAGGARGAGGFAALTRYFDRLASYMIPPAAAGAVLGMIYGGALFMSGSPQAGRILGYVAIGVVVVLASKGLIA